MGERGREVDYARYALQFRVRQFETFHSQVELALVWCHTREIHRAGLISLAQAGWLVAHQLLWRMAEFLTKIGDPLPHWLQRYIVGSARDRRPTGRRKRGRDPLSNLFRDIVIAQAVAMVTQAYRLRPTRNAATTAECGCSIVRTALAAEGSHMSEATVTSIWRWYEGKEPLRRSSKQQRASKGRGEQRRLSK
jgi:hypothetical protein